MDTIFLNEHRCICGKLLFRGIFFDAKLEIKCKKCGTINKIGLIKLLDDPNHYALIINDKGIITNASKSACHILGYSCEELIGKSFIIIDPKTPKDIGKKIFGTCPVLSEDNYFEIETHHITKRGDSVPVTIFLKIYKSADKNKYVLLSAKLLNVKDEVGVNQNSNTKFSNNSCDFCFDIDKNAIVTYVSPSLKTIFGISQEEAIGQSYFNFVPEKLKEEEMKNFEYFSNLKQSYRRKNNNGKFIKNKPVYYEVYFTSKFNDVGNFIGYRVLGWVKEKR